MRTLLVLKSWQEIQGFPKKNGQTILTIACGKSFSSLYR